MRKSPQWLLGLLALMAAACGESEVEETDTWLLPPATEAEWAVWIDVVASPPDFEPVAPANNPSGDVCADNCSGEFVNQCFAAVLNTYGQQGACDDRCRMGCFDMYYANESSLQRLQAQRECPAICQTAGGSASTCRVSYCDSRNLACLYIFDERFTDDPGYDGDATQCRDACLQGCATWHKQPADSTPNATCLRFCPDT